MTIPSCGTAELKKKNCQEVWFRIMVFSTFNNISVIFWQSILMVEETGVDRENHRRVTSH
jgi:hypothetical protein